MNPFWHFALDTDIAEILVKLLIVTGFVIGCLWEDWATGIVYGMLAPFLLIPIGAVAMLLGLVFELWQLLKK